MVLQNHEHHGFEPKEGALEVKHLLNWLVKLMPLYQRLSDLVLLSHSIFELSAALQNEQVVLPHNSIEVVDHVSNGVELVEASYR